jgi:hypothetical protein
MRYRIFDRVVDSDIPLPELPAFHGQRAAIDFEVRSARSAAPYGPELPSRSRDEAARTRIPMAVAPIGADYLVSFPALADFRIDGGRNRVECFPAGGISEPLLRHLLLDQVIPRLVGQRGQLVLHASAVELPDGKGVVFIGKSGSGKSTMASSFYRSGARLVADDCLLLYEVDGRVAGIPSYAGLRLWTDSAAALFPRRAASDAVSELSDKQRVVLHDRPGPFDVRAIFLLADAGPEVRTSDAAIDPIEGAEAVMALIRCGFMLDPHDLTAVARQFASTGRIVAAGPAVYSLRYPREFGRLAEVRATVVAAVAL